MLRACSTKPLLQLRLQAHRLLLAPCQQRQRSMQLLCNCSRTTLPHTCALLCLLPPKLTLR